MSKFIQVIQVVTTICDAEICLQPSRLIDAEVPFLHSDRENVDVHTKCFSRSRNRNSNFVVKTNARVE